MNIITLASLFLSFQQTRLCCGGHTCSEGPASPGEEGIQAGGQQGSFLPRLLPLQRQDSGDDGDQPLEQPHRAARQKDFSLWQKTQDQMPHSGLDNFSLSN